MDGVSRKSQLVGGRGCAGSGDPRTTSPVASARTTGLGFVVRRLGVVSVALFPATSGGSDSSPGNRVWRDLDMRESGQWAVGSGQLDPRAANCDNLRAKSACYGRIVGVVVAERQAAG